MLGGGEVHKRSGHSSGRACTGQGLKPLKPGSSRKEIRWLQEELEECSVFRATTLTCHGARLRSTVSQILVIPHQIHLFEIDSALCWMNVLLFY